MGKSAPQLPVQHQENRGSLSNSSLCCCGMWWNLRSRRVFSLKCVVLLVFSVAALLSGLFWVFPFRVGDSGFDAKESIKLKAAVQAYFKLEKPVSLLIPQIPKLEYDIYSEIGVPYTKVAILSMHEADSSNSTSVVFGILPDPLDSPINAVSLSVLKSSLIELFLQQANLTLTNSVFGVPSSFEILKCVGGITVIPEQYESIWVLPRVYFSFTLQSSIYEIKENTEELREQLKLGLSLKPYENVFVQLTSNKGSTIGTPVVVQTSVTSEEGNILPQRLKQLAQIIRGSSAKNLGLDNSVFGKVKEVSLSSFLSHTLDANPPSPSPAPSQEQNDYMAPSSSPAISPSFSPAPSACFDCITSSPSPNSSPPLSNSPAPSPGCAPEISPSPSPIFQPPNPPVFPPHGSPISEISPGIAPLPDVSHGSHSGEKSPVPSPSVLPSSSSSMARHSYKPATFSFFFTLTTLCTLFWSNLR